MSTLPFLLSVADELDNLNSQSYMDDFGLGFHPHRQYYRTPTIQLSLPASTEWMPQEQRQRCRIHKFVDETQNNLQATSEADDEDTEAYGGGGGGVAVGVEHDAASTADSNYTDMYGDDRYEAGASTSARSRQKMKSALNSNKGEKDDECDNIDNSVQMYNLSKKCCKNYHRHSHRHDDAAATTAAMKQKSHEGFRLNSKCLEGNNSSSDESLQKVSSSIEFLTCFLLKKSRASKNTNNSGGSSNNKKSS